jgi:hypothetical protein
LWRRRYPANPIRNIKLAGNHGFVVRPVLARPVFFVVVCVEAAPVGDGARARGRPSERAKFFNVFKARTDRESSE